MLEKLKQYKWQAIAIAVGVCMQIGLYFAARQSGYESGQRDGFDRAARDIRCDNGSHIPSPWRKEKK